MLLSDGAFGELPDVNLSSGELQFHQVGRRADNVGIVALDVRKSFSNDYDYQCFAAIRNFSRTRKKCNLELYRNDNLIDVREIDLRPQGRRRSCSNGSAAGAGLLRARLDLNDDLAADNEAYTLLAPRRAVNLLLVTTGNRFLERALNLDPGGAGREDAALRLHRQRATTSSCSTACRQRSWGRATPCSSTPPRRKRPRR